MSRPLEIGRLLAPLGGALVVGAAVGALAVEGPRVVIQLRLLACLMAGGAIFAAARARRVEAAFSGALVGHLVGALVVPDGARLLVPALTWGAIAAALATTAAQLRGHGWARRADWVAPAWIGVNTATAVGVYAAACVALGRALGPVAGLPLAIAGLVVSASAAARAVGPVDWRLSAAIVAALSLAKWILSARQVARSRLFAAALILSVALAVALEVGLRPGEALAAAVAERIEAQRLPFHDARGWRRLWRYEHRRADDGGPIDVGVP